MKGSYGLQASSSAGGAWERRTLKVDRWMTAIAESMWGLEAWTRSFELHSSMDHTLETIVTMRDVWRLRSFGYRVL